MHKQIWFVGLYVGFVFTSYGRVKYLLEGIKSHIRNGSNQTREVKLDTGRIRNSRKWYPQKHTKRESFLFAMKYQHYGKRSESLMKHWIH
jgi:hypothetical protein